MTKAELIKALEPHPDNADVFVDSLRFDDTFRYQLVNDVSFEVIPMHEETGKLKASEQVIVIELF